MRRTDASGQAASVDTHSRVRLSQGEWGVIAIGAGIALALLYGFYVAVVGAVDRAHARHAEARLAAERPAVCAGVSRCARADAPTDDALPLQAPIGVPKRLVRNVVLSTGAR